MFLKRYETHHSWNKNNKIKCLFDLDTSAIDLIASRTRSRLPMPDVEVEELAASFKPPDAVDAGEDVGEFLQLLSLLHSF